MTDKTSASEAKRIERLRKTSPLMAAMTSNADNYRYLAACDALWAELDSYQAS